MGKSSETTSYKGGDDFAVILRGLLEHHPKTREKTTYKALAEYLSVKQQSVSSWATGATIPDTKHIRPIAEYFGVSCDYLLGRTRAAAPDDLTEAAVERYGLTEEALEGLQEIYRQFQRKRGIKAKDRQDPFYNAYNALNAMLYKNGLVIPGLFVLNFIGLFLDEDGEKDIDKSATDPAFDFGDFTQENLAIVGITNALTKTKEQLKEMEVTTNGKHT